MNVKSNSVRTIEFNGLKIGGESSFPIFNPVFVLSVPAFDMEKFNESQASEADIVGIKFALSEVEQVPEAVEFLSKLVCKKPLLIQGSNNNEIDKVLLPELAKALKQPAIIAFGNDNTYKYIVPEVVKGGHVLVLRSPIDINLAKELNILSGDMGLSLDKILIDSDIGGLGYGFEYGYSIMEKIKLEGLKGDDYLNMPLISFACDETLKTKEAKSENMSESWGDVQDRARRLELTAASAVMAAGANIIVMNYPENIEVMKGLR